MLHCIGDGLLGDGIEHHPFDLLVLEGILLFQHLKHVPGDRLAFAVGVGGKYQLGGAFHGAGDVVDPLLGAFVDLPDHFEIVVRIYRPVLRRQVANVAERSQNLVARAEIFIDGFGLGRRLDDNDIHVFPMA